MWRCALWSAPACPLNFLFLFSWLATSEGPKSHRCPHKHRPGLKAPTAGLPGARPRHHPDPASATGQPGLHRTKERQHPSGAYPTEGSPAAASESPHPAKAYYLRPRHHPDQNSSCSTRQSSPSSTGLLPLPSDCGAPAGTSGSRRKTRTTKKCKRPYAAEEANRQLHQTVVYQREAEAPRRQTWRISSRRSQRSCPSSTLSRQAHPGTH